VWYDLNNLWVLKIIAAIEFLGWFLKFRTVGTESTTKQSPGDSCESWLPFLSDFSKALVTNNKVYQSNLPVVLTYSLCLLVQCNNYLSM
jgi:hypothetical protein